MPIQQTLKSNTTYTVGKDVKSYTIGEAASYLGISRDTLRRWEKNGKIKASRTPGRQRVYSEDDLFLIKNLQAPLPAPQEPVSVILPPTQTKTKLRLLFSLTALLLGLILFFQTPFLSTTKNLFTDYLVSVLKKIVTPEGRVISEKTGPSSFLSSSTNLIANSSFEAGNLNARPEFWTYLSQSNVGNTLVSIESIRTGTQSVKIADSGCEISRCQIGLSQPTTKTINGRNYILSIYIRTKDIKGHPKVRLGFFGSASTADPNYRLGAKNWTSYAADKYEDFTLEPFSDWIRFSVKIENAALDKYPLFEIIDYQGGEIFAEDAGLFEVQAQGENLASSIFASAADSPLFFQSNIKIGDNSLVADPSANLYPVRNQTGSLGINDNRFTSLYLKNAQINADGNLTAEGTATFGGDLSIKGSSTLGDSTSDTLDVKARIKSSLLPNTSDAYDLGSSALKWNNLYSVNMTLAGDLAVNGGDITSTSTTFNLLNSTVTTLNIGGAATTISLGASTGTTTINNNLTVTGNLVPGATSGQQGWWQRASGALSPANITDDLLLGATATNSALIKLTGTSGGNSWINTGNLGIGITSPTVALDVVGAGKFSTNLAASTGNINLADTSGNISIGNASGTLALTSSAFNLTTAGAVSGVTTLSISNQLTNSYANIAALNLTGNGAGMTFTGTGPNQIITASGVNLALMPGGNVGVGTTAPSAKVDIIGNLAVSTYATVSGSLGIGTTAAVAGPGNLNMSGNLNVAGNVTLGTTTSNTLTVSGYVNSDLIPQTGSLYNLGSTTRRWLNVWADTVTASNLSGTVVTGSTSANDWLINSDNATSDTEDDTLTFERGTPAVNAEIRWNSTSKWLSTNVPSFVISPDSGITASGKAALIINQIQNQDILTASASGIPKFVITNAGNVGIGNTNPGSALTIGNNAFTVTSAGVVTGGTYNKVTITAPATGSTLTIAEGKTLTANNSLTLAGTDATTITFQGTDTYVGRTTTDTLTNKTLSSSTNVLGGVTMTLGSDATGDIYYRNSSEVLTRLAIGTANQVLHGGTTPSYSAIAAGDVTADSLDFTEFKDAMALDALTKVNLNNFDFGFYGTGNVGVGTTSPVNALTVSGNMDITGNLGIGNTGPTYKLDVAGGANLSSGNAYFIAGTSVLNATTLGSGVLSSSLTSVGALASGTIASGFGTIATANTITGTTLNATTGINTGAGAGTLRLDSAGALSNITTLSLSGAISGGTTYSGSGNITSTTGILTISGTGNSSFAGNVGIGTTSPAGLLHVATSTTALGLSIFEQASADTDSYDLSFKKARGTVASPTVITTADELGTILFRGYGGASGYVTGAAIKAISSGTIADTRVPGVLSFWTGTDAAPTVLTERMRIDKAGNVGIGTTSPASLLDVNGTAWLRGTGTSGLFVNSSGNVGIGTTGPTSPLHVVDSSAVGTQSWAIQAQKNYNSTSLSSAIGGGLNVYNNDTTANNYGAIGFVGNTNTAVSFGTIANIMTSHTVGSESSDFAFLLKNSGSYGERMRITGSGNVGIGTTSPLALLDVNGVGAHGLGAVGAPSFAIRTDLDSGMWSSGANTLNFSTGGSERVRIDSSGNVGIGTTGPNKPLHVVGISSLGAAVTSNLYSFAPSVGNKQLWLTSGTAQAINTGSVLVLAGQDRAADDRQTAFGSIAGLKENSTNSNINGFLAFYTSNDTAGGSGERVRIDSSGNVGIGTTGPARLLSIGTNDAIIQGGTAYGIQLSADDAGHAVFGSNLYVDSAAALKTAGTHASYGYSGIHQTWGDIKFYAESGATTADATVTPTAKMVILDSGNVGIGTTGPGEKLEVSGNITIAGTTTNRLILPLYNSASSPTIGFGDADTGFYESGDDTLVVTTGGYARMVWSGAEVRNTNTNSWILLNEEASATNPVFSIRGDDNTGIGWAGADILSLIAGGTNVLNVTSGNVGIGTTSPAGALHVIGSCVTGDTLLKRRRRRKKGKNGEWIEDWQDVRIDQIKPGDEILTLDEATGNLIVSKVKALMDMGTKAIVKLTTALGKTIRTTANHPYLVKTSPKTKARVGIFIDDSNLYFGAKKAGFRIDYNKLLLLLKKRFEVKLANYYIVIPDPEKDRRSYRGTLDYFTKLSKEFSLKKKPLKYILGDDGINEKKGDVDLEIALDVTRNIDNLDLIIVVSGDSDYLELVKFVEKEHGKQIAFVSYKRSLAWELRLQKHLFVEKIRPWVELGAKKNPDLSVGATYLSYLYQDIASLSRGKWRKVSQIKRGDEIAVTGRFGKAIWDKVVKIEKLPVEQVFDIEVEGTHNFVANGIIAHNTYISGNVGIGTTSPTALLHLGIGSTAVVGQKIVLASGATANAFEVNSSTGVGGDLVVMKSSGNVGIGTTSPLALLDVNGVGAHGLGAVGAPSFAIRTDLDSGMWSSGANTLNFSTGGSERVRIDSSGNVGIGTTGPGVKLDVRGQLSVQNSSAALYDSTIINTNGAVGNTAGLGFSSQASYNIKAAMYHIRTGSYDVGDLVFALANASDWNNVTTADEKVRITSSGNVGIGTTGPTASLHIVNSGDKIGLNIETPGVSNNSSFNLYLPLSTGVNDGKAFSFTVPGESYSRGMFYSDGAYGIGPGSAIRDTFIRRSTTSTLMIDSNKTGGTANLIVTGNVGIGTTGPAQLLQVAGIAQINTSLYMGTAGGAQEGDDNLIKPAAASAWLNVKGGSGKAKISLGNSTMYIDSGNDAGGAIVFKNDATSSTNGGTEVMRITGGNVGIGTTSPASLLDVNGTAWLRGTGTSGLFVNSSGNVGIGTTAPSRLLDLLSTTSSDILNINDGASNSIFSIEDGGGISITGSAFDAVIYYNGTACTDNTSDAKTSGSAGGYTITSGATTYTYSGLDHKFTSIYFNVRTAQVGSGTTVAQYWNGSTWATLTVTDNTSNFTVDGAITFTPPSDWATTTMSGTGCDSTNARYYVRLSLDATPTTAPLANSTSPRGQEATFKILNLPGDTSAIYMDHSGGLSVNASRTKSTFNRDGNDGTIISLQQDGTEEGTISVSTTTVSYNAFTGSHIAWTDEQIERGMIVSLTGENKYLHDNPGSEIIYGITKTTMANDSKVLGSYLSRLRPDDIDEPVTENPYLIMTVGNGDMWVADYGKNISRGDYLISSDTPGQAMKDNGQFEVSNIIARAGEDVNWESVSETVNGRKHKKISVFFENFVKQPTYRLNDIGELFQTGPKEFSLTDTAGNTISQIGAFAEAAIANLTAGQVKTELISPLAQSLTIDLSNTATTSGFRKLIIKGESGEEVASIDSAGNVKALSIEVDSAHVLNNATINGTLYVDEIVAHKGSFGEILASTVSAQTIQLATLASQGVALRSYSEMDTRLANLETQTAASNAAIASVSAQLAALKEEIANLQVGLPDPGSSLGSNDPGSLSVETATISGDLTVLGKTLLSDLGVTGKLTIGLLTIDGLSTPLGTPVGCTTTVGSPDGCAGETGASLSTLSGPLKLQELALGNLEMMGGKIVIDTKGNLKVEGTITAKKVETEEIKILGAKTAGSGVLPAGQTEVEIEAEASTSSARILLTPTTLTDKILTVIEKGLGNFKVGINASVSAEIKFDWFVVQ